MLRRISRDAKCAHNNFLIGRLIPLSVKFSFLQENRLRSRNRYHKGPFETVNRQLTMAMTMARFRIIFDGSFHIFRKGPCYGADRRMENQCLYKYLVNV